MLDRAWVNADLINPPQNGVQTVVVPAGGAGVFDVKLDKEGLYPFVSHAFAHVDLGQVGLLKVGNPAGDDVALAVMAVLTNATEENAAADVILRDGSTLRLRPPARDDADALCPLLRQLSDQSLYLRFHGHPSVDADLVAADLEPDWVERGALIGAVATDDGECVVTLAGYVRLRDREVAEVSFAVADGYQGRGIGPRLLEQLAARAARQGITRFVAEVIADNRPMLRVFSEAGFSLSRTLSGGVVEVTFPIATTAAYLARVAARDHTAVAASVRPFFEPRSVAVFGASARRGTIGGELFRNILAGDFSGAAYPINRSGQSVAGVRGYGSIDEIADAVALGVICVPATAVLEAVESALRNGVRALMVVSAGSLRSVPKGPSGSGNSLPSYALTAPA